MGDIVLKTYDKVTSTDDFKPGDVVRNERGELLTITGIARIIVNPSECPDFDGPQWDRETSQWMDWD